MKWFWTTRTEKLKLLLKKSGSDFQFNPNPTKYRLMTSIERMDQKPRPYFSISRVAKYSVSFALVVIFVSGTIAVATTSKPGDALFTLNKLGEQAILSLPLSVEQKAKMETYIVNSRVAALNQVQVLDQVQANTPASVAAVDAKNLATVKETDDSFSAAVNVISQDKQASEAAGNTQTATQLENNLDQLQNQAQQSITTITSLVDQTSNPDVKAKLQTHLSQVISTGEKARSQIKRFQDAPDQNKNDNGNTNKQSDNNSTHQTDNKTPDNSAKPKTVAPTPTPPPTKTTVHQKPD